MGLLLQSVKAGHKDHWGEKNANRDHKAQENFIVEVIRCKCRLYSHLVCHIFKLSLRKPIAYLLQPAGVVEHNEDITVQLVLTEEVVVARAPFFHLLKDTIRFFSNEVAHVCQTMFKPHGRRLYIAIIVSFRLKNEHIELFVVDKSEFRGGVDTFDGDFLASLCDVGL